jgi:UrcA family protein
MNAIIAKSIIGVCFAAALAGYSAATHAHESGGSVRSIIVGYAELDLSKSQGIEVLYQRIQGAAKRVCRADPGSIFVRDPRAWKKCYVDATERAVRQVNLPTLTALHQSRTSSAVG